MNVVSYKAEHLYALDLQESQAYLSSWITPDQAQALEDHGWAYTGMVNGTPVACAGVIQMWQGRGMAWAYISKYAARQHFLAVHKAVSRFLEACYIQRIEMSN